MKSRYKLSDKKCSEIQISAGKAEDQYVDAVESHLVFRVFKDGRKSFYFRKWDKTKKSWKNRKLGDYPELSVVEARVGARDHAARFAPITNDDTLGSLFKRYIDEHCKVHLKPSTIRSYLWNWPTSLEKWGNKPLTWFTPDRCKMIHFDIANESGADKTRKSNRKDAANKAIQMLSTLFNYASKSSGAKFNPTEGVKRYKLKRNRTWIEGEELGRFVQSAMYIRNTNHYCTVAADVILALLMTGVRFNNLISSRWKSIDWEKRTWTFEDTKNGERHVVYLTEPLEKLLKVRKRVSYSNRPYVFESLKIDDHLKNPRKTFATILELAGLEKSLNFHGLKHSFVSLCVNAEISPVVAQAMAGHKSQAITFRVYTHLSEEVVREAYEKVHNRILELAGYDKNKWGELIDELLLIA